MIRLELDFECLADDDLDALVEAVVEAIQDVIDPDCTLDEPCVREWSAVAKDVTTEYEDSVVEFAVDPSLN